MKKEKTVRTYQRRTKSGKMVTVREHKASYDAAEEARKAAAKKAGAGSELSKKKAVKEESPLGFSADDYKEWYHWDMEDDPKNEAALRVEKALIKKMGKKAYNKYLEDMSNSYSARGHKKAHQSLLDEYTARQKKQDAEIKAAAKDISRGAKEKAAEAKASKVSAKATKVSTASSFMDDYNDMNALREYASRVMDDITPYKAKTKKELKRMFDADQGKAGSHEETFKKFLKDEWLPNKDNVQSDRNFYLGGKESPAKKSGKPTSAKKPTSTKSEVPKKFDYVMVHEGKDGRKGYRVSDGRIWTKGADGKMTEVKPSSLPKEIQRLYKENEKDFDRSKKTAKMKSPTIPKSESALKKAGWTYVRTNRGKVGGGSIGYWVSPDRETMISGKSSYRPGSGKSVSIEADKPKKVTKSVLALLDKDSRASTTSAKKETSSKTKKTMNEVIEESGGKRITSGGAVRLNGELIPHAHYKAYKRTKSEKKRQEILALLPPKKRKILEEHFKNNVGSKKPLTSYQNHAINTLLNQPGWTMSKAEKYVRTLSDREVQRLAHKDM